MADRTDEIVDKLKAETTYVGYDSGSLKLRKGWDITDIREHDVHSKITALYYITYDSNTDTNYVFFGVFRTGTFIGDCVYHSDILDISVLVRTYYINNTKLSYVYYSHSQNLCCVTKLKSTEELIRKYREHFYEDNNLKNITKIQGLQCSEDNRIVTYFPLIFVYDGEFRPVSGHFPCYWSIRKYNHKEINWLEQKFIDVRDRINSVAGFVNAAANSNGEPVSIEVTYEAASDKLTINLLNEEGFTYVNLDVNELNKLTSALLLSPHLRVITDKPIPLYISVTDFCFEPLNTESQNKIFFNRKKEIEPKAAFDLDVVFISRDNMGEVYRSNWVIPVFNKILAESEKEFPYKHLIVDVHMTSSLNEYVKRIYDKSKQALLNFRRL